MLDRKNRTQRTRLLPMLVIALLAVAFAAYVVRAKLVHSMRLPRLTLEQNAGVIGVAITPDGRTAFSGDTMDTIPSRRAHRTADILVWDTSSGRLRRRLPGFPWRASGVIASPDGLSVAAAGIARPYKREELSDDVREWNWRTGQVRWTVPGTLPLCFSPDGSKIGIVNAIYDANNGKLLCRTGANSDYGNPCHFTPDSQLYGVVDSIKLDPRTGHLDESQGPGSYASTTRLHLWRSDTGKEARDFPFTRVRDFDFSHDGKRLVMVSDREALIDGHFISGGTNGAVVRCIDFDTGAVVWTRERTYNAPDHDADASVNSVAFSPNGKFVVLESMGTRLIVLDAATGRELFRTLVPFHRSGSGWILSGGLAFSADGRTLVSRGENSTLVWDARALQ